MTMMMMVGSSARDEGGVDDDDRTSCPQVSSPVDHVTTFPGSGSSRQRGLALFFCAAPSSSYSSSSSSPLFLVFTALPLLLLLLCGRQANAQQLTSFDVSDPASFGPALDAVAAIAAAAGDGSGGDADCTGRIQWSSEDFATSEVLLPCGRVTEQQRHTSELEDSSSSRDGASSEDDPYGVQSACATCLAGVGAVLVPRMLEAGLNPVDPTLVRKWQGRGVGREIMQGMPIDVVGVCCFLVLYFYFFCFPHHG